MAIGVRAALTEAAVQCGLMSQAETHERRLQLMDLVGVFLFARHQCQRTGQRNLMEPAVRVKN